MKASELRTGMAAMLDGQLYVCVKAKHVTPGNLRAFVQAKLRRVSDGVIIEKRLRSTEDIEEAFMDRREMEYLYSDSNGHILMDNKTYDQITVPDEMIGEAIKYYKPNTSVITLVHDGNVVSIELPKTVDLKVTETSPAVKGATVTNQMKEAVLETGLKTRVPQFIEVGDVVRVNTDEGEYLGRAKE
jgi:elongation factor P